MGLSKLTGSIEKYPGNGDQRKRARDLRGRLIQQGSHHLRKGGESRTYNLGSGAGYSVRDVIKRVRQVAGVDLPVIECSRRAVDPARLSASVKKISQDWNWQPKRDLTEIIKTAWLWEIKLNQNIY